MEDIITAEQIIGPQELASLLKVSVKWVYDHTTRSKPTIPHIRLGGHLRFRKSTVMRWVEQMETS